MSIQGLGGVFIKVKNKQETIEWYKENLNFKFHDDAIVFKKHKGQFEVLAFFSDDSEYYKNKECMLNLRVEKLEEFLQALKSKGVRTEDKIETYEYGKFGWIYDLNGNKVELWESNDEKFSELYSDDV
jgi:uncharacterized glyoxalase superfamily protein PhnB